jgi:hypothetical protein
MLWRAFLQDSQQMPERLAVVQSVQVQLMRAAESTWRH